MSDNPHTVEQRLLFVAQELKALEETDAGKREATLAFSALMDIGMGNYNDAIAKLTGNYEPLDPPGFEGGFADNH